MPDSNDSVSENQDTPSLESDLEEVILEVDGKE